MKITASLVLVILALGLMAYYICHRDATDSKALQGVWVVEFNSSTGDIFKSTTTIAENGDYICHILTRTQNVNRNAELEGNMSIKKRVLIDVIKKHSDSKVPFPQTNYSKIIRMSDHELVIENQHPSGDSVFRKIK